MGHQQKFIEAYMAEISGWKDCIHLSGTELIEGIIGGLNIHAIAEAERLISNPYALWPDLCDSCLKIEKIEQSMLKLLEQLPVFQDLDLDDLNDFSEKLHEHTFLEENLSEILQDPITKNLCKQFGLLVCYHYYRLTNMEASILDLEEKGIMVTDREAVKKYKSIKEAMEQSPGSFVQRYNFPI